MGEANNKWNKRHIFLMTHPRCAFCGGETPATTIEHCPPRSLFQHRHWPEGFEFPACDACNHGTSDHDVLVSVLARLGQIEGMGDKDGALAGLLKNVNKQNPGLLTKMMPSPSEARLNNRKFSVQPAPGQTHQEAGPVKIPNEMHQAVCVFARKLAKGIFYRETNTPFPSSGCLLLNWFTNAELLRHGKYVVFDLLKEIAGNVPSLQRSQKFLNSQFEYKISISSEWEFFVIQALFGHSFGFVIFGSTLPGRLESMVERMREQTNKNGPFVVLQSASLT